MDCGLLLNTVALRPYVFIFLVVYSFGCALHLGIKRTFLYSIAGYAIAWLSEYSSIHNGFPYGHYYYIENTKNSELWVLGVPFMDSISYVFLSYASYSMALIFTSPLRKMKWWVYLLETRQKRHSFSAAIIATAFLVCLDVVIDPVALRGDRWFLGKIYGYPDNGIYFGVPLSNFAGWAVVGFLLISTLQKIDGYLGSNRASDWVGYSYPWRYLIGPALYLGVLIFNLAVTFAIGECALGLAGICISLPPLLFLYRKVRLKLKAEGQRDTIEAHLRDFPEAVLPDSP